MTILTKTWILGALLLIACSRESEEELGVSRPEQVDLSRLSRPETLLQIGAVPMEERMRRLGAQHLECDTT